MTKAKQAKEKRRQSNESQSLATDERLDWGFLQESRHSSRLLLRFVEAWMNATAMEWIHWIRHCRGFMWFSLPPGSEDGVTDFWAILCNGYVTLEKSSGWRNLTPTFLRQLNPTSATVTRNNINHSSSDSWVGFSRRFSAILSGSFGYFQVLWDSLRLLEIVSGFSGFSSSVRDPSEFFAILPLTPFRIPADFRTFNSRWKQFEIISTGFFSNLIRVHDNQRCSGRPTDSCRPFPRCPAIFRPENHP